MDADSDLAAVHRMKIWIKIILLVVGLMGISHKASAAQACLLTLQWQASSDPTVAGYALYYGVDGSPITNRIDTGAAAETTVNGLVVSSTYSFYVVAYDADLNESDPSNLLLYTAQAITSLQVSPMTAGMVSISFHVAPGGACHLEYTDTLNPPNWNVLTVAVADSSGLVTISDPVAPTGSRYYRGVVP
jgi:hypothetical protein